MSISETVMKARSEVLIIAMVGREAGVKWWDSQNKAFDMKTPNEQWSIDPAVVYNYLMNQGFGR